MRYIFKLHTVVLSLCLFAIPAWAQSGKPNEAALIERAEMVAEIKKLREENATLKLQKTELETQISQFRELDSLQEARVAELKTTIEAKDRALQYTEKIEKLYEQRIADYKEENVRLRGENDKLRSSKNKYGILGLISGIALTLILK